MLKKYFSYSLFLVCLHVLLLGQNGITGNPDWQIKPAINTGFILVHRTSIGNLVKGYPVIYECNVSKPTLGNKLWHLENNKPDVGISLQCIDFRNPKQLGYGFVVAPFMEIPLNAKEKTSRVVMRLCWGITYVNKKFDIYTNHKNDAIGSHVNAFVQFKWMWHLQLTEHLRFEPGFAFTHASNGKAKNPNLGLNVVSLNAGLNYFIPSKQKLQVLKIDSSTKVKCKNEIIILAATGINQRSIGSKELKTFLGSVAFQRNVRNTHKYSIGLDVFYDENYLIDYQNVFLEAPKSINRLRASARLGYSYNVGRISFPIELGYYVFQKANPDASMVSRIGVRYYSKSGIIAHFGLRTHFAVAYNFEFGLGYRFYLK